MSKNFTVIKKGYNPIEVDAYVAELEKKLADHKEQSAIINKAIINAQFAADNIIKTAHAETEQLIREAENHAHRIKQKNLNQVVMLRNTIAKQKRMIEEFQADYKALVKKYLADIQQEDISPLVNRLQELENIITELTEFDNQQEETKTQAIGELSPTDAPSPENATLSDKTVTPFVPPVIDKISGKPVTSASPNQAGTEPANASAAKPANETDAQAKKPEQPPNAAPSSPVPPAKNITESETAAFKPELLTPQGASANYRPAARVDSSYQMNESYEENIKALKELMPDALVEGNEYGRSSSVLNQEELSALLPFSAPPAKE